MRAPALWKALDATRKAFKHGEHHAFRLGELARETLQAEGLQVDYAEVRDPVKLEKQERAEPTSRLFLAAFLGKTRLIDNGALRD
jgi:pantoate--beta-alanine ligase